MAEPPQESNQAIVTWSGEDSWFIAALPGEHEINIDEPEPIGRNHGGRPTDLLLGSAASCSSISTVALLRKLRQPISALVVTASGERQAEWPKAFTSIKLRFQIMVSSGFDSDLTRKAVELAVRKYCPVSATIELGTGGCRIEYDVEIVEVDDPVPRSLRPGAREGEPQGRSSSLLDTL